MIIYLPLLIALIGLVMYLACNPADNKLCEIGRIMFWTGLLAFLLTAHQIVPVLR